jgi:hypothetical protein
MTEPGKPEKYDIFISIIVMNGAYTGKISALSQRCISTQPRKLIQHIPLWFTNPALLNLLPN